jgi:TatD DNase family protein
MFFDAHAHIDKYQRELDIALEQIFFQKIFTLSVSMDIDSYQRNREIAQRSEFIIPAFGIHPWEAPRFSKNLSALDSYLQDTPIFGEIGLDFHFVKDSSSYKAQRIILEYFLNEAVTHQKLVNLHTKGAEVQVLELMEEYKIPHSIVHWYSGPINLIERYLSIGSYFTMGIELVTSKHIQAVLDVIPDNRLLTETDNPGGNLCLNQSIGMPEIIRDVIRAIGIYRHLSENEAISLVEQNFETLIVNWPQILRKWNSLKSNA